MLENEADIQRSKQIAARQLVREITQQPNLQKMMDDLVELFCTQFGFYFAGIYLADDRNEYAILRAASGQVGKQLISQGHQLRIREEGIVGYVIARGDTRIALDVDVDSVHKKNPLLPETKSEVGIPLKISSKMIGAIDIQSNKESGFSQDEIDILQGIADQLAVTISKSQQIQNLESEILELRTGLGESVKGVWRSHLQGSQKTLGYVYRINTLIPESTVPALESLNENTQAPTISTYKDHSVLNIPIRLRDQVLGVINLNYSGKKIPGRLYNLVNTATDRLAIALENARLLETIQERAEREHTVAEISSKVRSAQNVESILQTAVMELSKTLGVSEVSVQLRTLSNTEQGPSVED
jgi:GAF domain-containing protein